MDHAAILSKVVTGAGLDKSTTFGVLSEHTF